MVTKAHARATSCARATHRSAVQWSAEKRVRRSAGPEVAAFEKGIFATMPGVPGAGYGNSYALVIGSGAEACGGAPTVRVLSAGVGATFGYDPAPDALRDDRQCPSVGMNVRLIQPFTGSSDMRWG